MVAVKGKSDAITIYEVLGNKGEAKDHREIVAAYEAAFAAYAARDFERALAVLENNRSDAPSAGLIKSCMSFLQSSPLPYLLGVYLSVSK